MAKALSAEVLWQARQMYAEKDGLGRPVHSMMEIAARLGISETSVFRAVHNKGRFANRVNAPLPQTRTEEMWEKEAEQSLERLQQLLAEEKKELTPGQTKADRLLEQLQNGNDLRSTKGNQDDRREERPKSPLDE